MKILIDDCLYQEDIKYVAHIPIKWELLENRTLLLSGASGLLGSFIIDVLMYKNIYEKQDCRILAMGRNIQAAKERFGKYWNSPYFRFIQQDINEEIEEIEKADYVIHAASNTHPLQYSMDPIVTIRSNVVGTDHLLKYASQVGAKRFVFLSTVEIYGQNRGDTVGFTEDYCGYIDSNTLRAGYPEGKRTGEALCQAYAKQTKLEFVIPRLARVYGPTMRKDDSKAVSQFIRNAVNGEDIVLKSKGQQRYTYTYVADAVAGIFTVMLLGKAGEAYNITGGKGDITLHELATYISEESKTKVVYQIPDEAEAAGYSKADLAVLDGHKIQQLGYQEKYDVKEGIRRTLSILKNKPLVSIVIPVYNGSNYLREAIDSALNQTYDNCEVLVINDGSDDDGKTEAIALSYGDKIRYFYKKNGGVSSALNFGIKNMQGEYFSWLSHDDLYYPEKIEKEINAILCTGIPETLVQAEYEFYNQETKSMTPTDFLKYYELDQITNSFFSVLQMQIHACSALIHKSHFMRVGYFDENLKTIQDVDMWFRIFRGQRSLFLKDILHIVREHKEAGSATIDCYYEETRKEYIKLIRQLDDKEIEQVFGNTGIFLCRMAGFMKSYGGTDEVREIEERMKKLLPDPQKDKEPSFLHDILYRYTNGKAKKIAIYGSGQYGIRIKYDLDKRAAMPSYFVDQDERKQGTQIDGIPCKSKEEFLSQKEDTLLIVAMRNYTQVAEELEKNGIPYYITRQELDPILLKFPLAAEECEIAKFGKNTVENIYEVEK